MLLLERARACGVRVLQPAVLRARSVSERGWRIGIKTPTGMMDINCDFLVDASGRSAALRGRKQRKSPRTLALYGRWRGSGLPDEQRIEAGAEAWYWGVPLPDGTYNVMVFVDAGDFRRLGANSLSGTYLGLIGHSSLLSPCRDADLTEPVRVADATPYLDSENIGPCSIKVGEAALALDPLSSSGVQNAINTGLTGGIVLNTLLRCPAQADAAIRFYKSNLLESSKRHRHWSAERYGAVVHSGAFWRTRADDAVPISEAPPERAIGWGKTWSADQPVMLAPELSFVDEPCIVDDLITTKRALLRPGLDRPVAYIGGCDVEALLRPLYPGISLGALMQAWPVPARSKPLIAAWLLDRQFLEVNSERKPEGGGDERQ